MRRKRNRNKAAVKFDYLQPEVSQVPSEEIPSTPYLNQVAVPGLFGPSADTHLASRENSFQSIFSTINRMGGLDGIMSTIGKVQKMFGVFQQIKPIFSLFGAFGGAKASTKGLVPGHKTKKRVSKGKVQKKKHQMNIRRS